MDLSQDHKASLASEINRVKLKGGFVVGGRVAGRLAITRAFGDHGLKLQIDENGEVHN
jgi:serine/threonine protein phosphatase PrpC